MLGIATLVLGCWLIPCCVERSAALAAKGKKKNKSSDGKTVARSVTAKGTILSRKTLGKPWRIVTKKGKLYDGDLLLGLPGAMLESRNKAVRLALLADFDRESPYPIREAAVILHHNPDVDLDLTLDRGRIDLINQKKKGPAHVRLRVRKDTWDVTLDEPGTSLALELYARWPAGVPFTTKPGPKDVPTANLIFLALKGEVNLLHDGYEHALSAPPGPAMIEWDSVTGQDETPQKLEKLPPWAQTGGKQTVVAKAKKQGLNRFRKAIIANGVKATLEKYVNSDNKLERMLAVFGMGATDNLMGLANALREAKHPDVWQNGVEALRNWISRAPGNDQILYNALLRVGKFPQAEADTVLQLLHSFGEDDLGHPEVYQTLIDFLEHDRLAVRGLAYWHLSRLVPQGEAFGYNPLDSKEKREAAVAKWRKLIPEGKMPPKEKPKDSGK